MSIQTSPVTITHEGRRAIIRFDQSVVKQANQEGKQRRLNARRDNRYNDRAIYGEKTEGPVTEGRGVLAEYAVAYYLDQWDFRPEVNKPDTDRGDVVVNGISIEVKSTMRNDGCLIIPRKEDRKIPYVLAITDGHNGVTLAGWHVASLCQKDEYWRQNVPEPNYFVPQRDLLSAPYLRQLVEGQ